MVHRQKQRSPAAREGDAERKMAERVGRVLADLDQRLDGADLSDAEAIAAALRAAANRIELSPDRG